MNSVQIWNRLIGMHGPVVSGVEVVLGRVLSKVYEHAPNFVSAEPNLLLRLPIGQNRHAACPVISMSLILRATYLSSAALVRPTDLRGLSMFGVPLEGSATDAVDALRESNVCGLDLVTEKSRWLIYCSKATALEFSALPGHDPPDPQCSEVVAVSYYFNSVYTGSKPPIIAEPKGAIP